MEEQLYDTQVEEQQDPIPKPKKLRVKEFAAKIKAKYPDYKDVDDTELTNKILAKYPVYKDQVDLTPEVSEVKKKSSQVDFGESSLSAGNALSQSSGVGGENIPQIEMYTTPNGEMTPTDKISLAQKYNELNSRTIRHATGGEGTASQFLPDEKSQISAAKLKQDFPDVDLGGIYEETKDLHPDIIANHGKRLMAERDDNKQLYQRDLANLKWRSGFERQILDDVDKGNISPDEYNQIKHSIETLPQVTAEGDYSNQRGAIQSMSKAIQLYGGENKDKLQKDFAIEVSKVYGNPDNKIAYKFKDNPESEYLNDDEQLGLQYLKDVAPDKAGQYDRLMIDPKTLKDNPDALKGYNHLKQTLEETGIGLQLNSVNEELNEIYRTDRGDGMTLTPEQLTKATELEKKKEVLVQKQNELDKKYPERIENKVDDAVQEILGQRANYFGYLQGKAITGVAHTLEGIWEGVSSPFMSDASNSIRELGIMGENLKEQYTFHTTDKNKNLLTDQLVIKPELQSQIDAIKNNKVISDQEKESKLTALLKANTDKFGRVPIQNGKFNISPSSILYGLTDLGTSLLPFVAIEAATGGIGGASAAAKFLRTFTAAAATTFHDEYASAIMEGKPQSEAYKSAMAHTAINSFAMAGASTPTELRAMAKGNSSAEKIIAQMSDKEIQSVLSKGTPKGLKAFGQSLKERAKATPAMFGQGLKTGAKFEAYMAGANLINDKEVNLKQSLLGIANFGILGAGLGHIGYKSPTELQKSGLLEFGKNPDGFMTTLDEMKKDGHLNQAEYDHRKDLIEKSKEAYKTLPQANAKGQPLTETEKGEYIYNSVIKNEGNKSKVNLPPKQAEKAEITAMAADHANDLILDPKTDKQLEIRKSALESSLEKKDDNGKLELTDTERKNAEAELQAINGEIDTRKSFQKTEMKRRELQPKEETGVIVEEPRQVPQPVTLEESTVSVEPPMEVPEPIKLNEPNEQATIEEVKTNEIPITQEKGIIAEPPTGESIPPTTEVKAAEPFVEDKRTILSHRGLQEISTEFGLEDVTSRERKSDPQLFKDAENTSNKWMEEGVYPEKIEGLVNKAEEAEVLTDEQRVILQQHIANVRGEISSMDIKDPNYDTKLKELDRLVRAGETTRSAAGAALRIPFMSSTPNDLPSMMVEEMRISQTGELTTGQKETVQKEYNEISAAEKSYQEKIAALEEENTKLRAGKKVAETKSTTPKTKKTKEDFVTERQKIKEAINEKIRKAKEAANAPNAPQTKGISSRTKIDDLIVAAPEVFKLMKSYVEEGVIKLEEVTKKIYEDLKDNIKDLSQKDIHDVIAGVYNEKKATKNEIAAKIENIRIEAALINKLDALMRGEEPKTEKKKIQRNAEIEKLRQQIKSFGKEQKTPDQKSLDALKTKLKNEAENLKEQIRTGNFAKPEPKQPIKLDKEALELRDKVIKLRQNRDVRLLLQKRMAETGKEKGLRLAAEVLNIPRTLMTIADYSALLRQDLFFAAGHPKMTAAAAGEMFKQGWSQKIYDRWFADLKDHPRYDTMQKSKLAITDSLNHDLTKREENFMSSLSEKIPLIGKTVIKGSERSYTALLNKSRVDMFNYFADKMEERGVTYDNNPKAYKAMAEYINNATGRSDFGETLNRIAPILNSVFFSPRLIASRVNMLSYWMQPRFWTTLPKEVRIDYIRNWASLLAIGGSMMALAKMGGAEVEDDPRSSDFGKIRDGNTRWDIWGGAQPYIRVLAQITTGKRKSTKSGKMYDLNGDDIFGETKTGVAADFFRNKLAPVPGAAIDILSGRTGVGDKIVYQIGGAGAKEISLDQYVTQRILPMTITGTYEAIKDRGAKALLDVAIPSTFGVGTQTYGNENAPKKRHKPTKTKKPKKQ